MSAFFRTASGCIGPRLFGRRSQRPPSGGCRAFSAEPGRLLRFGQRASGIPRDFDRERLPQRQSPASLPETASGQQASAWPRPPGRETSPSVRTSPQTSAFRAWRQHAPFPGRIASRVRNLSRQTKNGSKQENKIISALKCLSFSSPPRREARPCDVSRETSPHLCFT